MSDRIHDAEEQHTTSQNGDTVSYLQALWHADFRPMLVFVAVVELNGIRQAARVLGCSEPSVCISLKRFREKYRHPLFIREGRKLEPTPEALSLARKLGKNFYLLSRTVGGTGLVS
ncbi:helix-turn-helix domain-containing protein [Citrobacter portucalensis]|uniref:helix-turn-helix domain-containing protein n=1 Tax=Citrobacter portucalensis TaxID=1639133 RepID=UPI001F1CD1D1|nr:LysR family transcriptional regulator [Citrobacter portucalensis]